MDEKELNEKLAALKANPESVKALENAETFEEVQKVFDKHGIKMSIDEIKMMVKLMNDESIAGDELDTADLQSVAGGGSDWAKFAWKCVKGCVNYGIMIGNAIFKNNARYI